MDARGFANVAHDCLANLMSCVQKERGCNWNPEWDEECRKCAFLLKPDYPDSRDMCALECMVYALEQYEREEN